MTRPTRVDDAGLDFHQSRSLAFYDAIIIASARIAGCNILLTEDMNSGEVIGGVRILDPFEAGQQPRSAS